MENPPAIVSTLDGVTTVIVAFLFVCLAMPQLVKNKTQYYAALVCVLLVILLHALSMMLIGSRSFVVVAAVFTGVLQIIAIIALVLCAGGLTVRQLGGEIAGAYEVIRRGEEEKEVIVPLSGQTPRRKADDDEGGRVVYHIESPLAPPAATPPGSTESAPPPAKENSSIPLE
jgi:hypothetical protein